MATARAVEAPYVEPASLRNLDPPMVQGIWPAGFPLREDSPRLLSNFSVGDRNMRQAHKKELAAQEPRYETSKPPYPSGFPLPPGSFHSSRTSRAQLGAGLNRIEKRHLYERPDPDIEITPSGFPELRSSEVTPRRISDPLAPVTPEPSKDYLTSYAEREARERLQQRLTPRPSPTESSAIQPRETTMVLKAWFAQTEQAVKEADKWSKIVEARLKEAQAKGQLSDDLKAESDEARRLEVEARNEAKEAPIRAREAVARYKAELGDAKANILNQARDVEDAKEMVKKAEYNRETKTAEAKVVANAARNKRNELTDLERMLARIDEVIHETADAKQIEEVRRETADAEQRAAQLEAELQRLTRAQKEREDDLERKMDALNRVRDEINDLSEKYSAALSEHETSNAVVQRNMKVAQALARDAEKKRAEAVRLAIEFDTAKNAAREAGQKEMETWRKAREVGEREERSYTDATAGLPVPKVTAERELAGEQLTPRPLNDIEFED